VITTALEFGPSPVLTAGVLTVNDWLHAPDGNTYKAIWSPRWEIVTDAEMPVASFRSGERWHAVAVVAGAAVVIIPGCRVHAWVGGAITGQPQGVLDARTLRGDR
jgi:hypothetical protein